MNSLTVYKLDDLQEKYGKLKKKCSNDDDCPDFFHCNKKYCELHIKCLKDDKHRCSIREKAKTLCNENYCNTEYCNYVEETKECTSKNSIECLSNDDCLTNNCFNNTCIGNTEHCFIRYNRNVPFCGKILGENCNDDSDCNTNYCFNNVCIEDYNNNNNKIYFLFVISYLLIMALASYIGYKMVLCCYNANKEKFENQNNDET